MMQSITSNARLGPCLAFGLSLLLLTRAGSGQAEKPAKGFAPDPLPKSWFTKAKRDPAAAKAASPKEALPEPDAKALRKKLETLLKDEGVAFLKTATCFSSGEGGGKAEILSPGDRWAVYKDGSFVGLFEDPVEVEMDLGDQVKARVLDLTKQSKTSFVMPGICDPDSRWFREKKDLSSSGGSLSIQARDALDLWEKGWQRLVLRGGVTSVFVPSGTASSSAGPGALVGLDPAKGPRVLSEEAALSYRLATVQTRGTTLSRATVVKGLEASLKSLEKYKEAKKKWKKDLEEYEKKRKEFLAWYKKHPLKPGDKPKVEKKREPSRRGGRRRGQISAEEMAKIREKIKDLPRDEQRKEFQRLMREAMRKAQGKTGKKPEKKPEKKADGKDPKKAPPRPKYPKKPKEDPNKEALIKILAKKATLRVEAHRKGEILALLALAEEYELENLVLTGATEAWKVAKELRKSGVTVLLTPHAIPARGFEALDEHLPASAAKLSTAGVPVAFGSAGRQEACFLTLLAARAVAHGMSPEQALKGLTWNAERATGASTGSLVVFSDSPLAPLSRVLCVLDGKTLLRVDAKAEGK